MNDMKIIRRVFKNRHDEGQTLVEVFLDEGVVRMATRPNQCATWGPPLAEILNEDKRS